MAAPRTAKRVATAKPPAVKRRATAGPRPAHQRGATTRAELIDAALDVFGRLGFEGATTRTIADAAGANLAAIVYHFGGKEALYGAVAEHVAQSIYSRIGHTLSTAADPAALADPAAARAAFERLIDTFIDVILGSDDAERWARFIIREQLQPTAAFDIIFRFMNGAAETATRLVAAIQGGKEDDALKLRVLTMMGQVLIFRVAQTMVLRRMRWRGIGQRQRDQIKRVVAENLTAILDRSAP